MFSVQFLNRDFSERQYHPWRSVDVLRYSFAARGGPKRAQLRATGSINDLWELAEMMRCPVIIWNTTTAELPPINPPPPDPNRLAKMPKRRRTRAADHTTRINTERQHNKLQRALENQRAAAVKHARQTGRPPPDYGDDPPPF